MIIVFRIFARSTLDKDSNAVLLETTGFCSLHSCSA
jgi:hypothetical protein